MVSDVIETFFHTYRNCEIPFLSKRIPQSLGRLQLSPIPG